MSEIFSLIEWMFKAGMIIGAVVWSVGVSMHLHAMRGELKAFKEALIQQGKKEGG